jgi:hypothetical protein
LRAGRHHRRRDGSSHRCNDKDVVPHRRIRSQIADRLAPAHHPAMRRAAYRSPEQCVLSATILSNPQEDGTTRPPSRLLFRNRPAMMRVPIRVPRHVPETIQWSLPLHTCLPCWL